MPLPSDYGEYCPNCEVEFDATELPDGRCVVCGHEPTIWPVTKAASEWLELETIYNAPALGQEAV
jgi:hypothetical protein